MMSFGLQGCDAFYGKAQALHDVTIEISKGEIVSLIGRNGAGKSTVLKASVGILPLARGQRLLNGKDESARQAHELSRLGIGYVPEGRRIFKNLTVKENLLISASAGRRGNWTLDRVLDLFPQLTQRLAAGGDTLSGGEQQMLAIGRSLLTNPKLLLLDEPTEGLAPLIVQDLVTAMKTINQEGISILLVEQNFRIPLQLAQYQYVIDSGRVVWKGSTAQFIEQRESVEALLGV